MIRALVDFALKSRWLVLGAVVVLSAWGVVSFRALPVEAYPDVANNYVSGKAPLQVNFTNESTGLVTSWLWSFGDGATSTDENPEHTYNSPKTYTAKLTVYGPGGTSSKTVSIRATK